MDLHPQVRLARDCGKYLTSHDVVLDDGLLLTVYPHGVALFCIEEHLPLPSPVAQLAEIFLQSLGVLGFVDLTKQEAIICEILMFEVMFSPMSLM